MSLRPAVAALAVVLAVGGCDTPTDPVPTNPYDPLFEGTRIGSTPNGFGLDASTPTSFTVGWPDVSTFETGYRIERRVPVPGRPGRVEVKTVARVGPDVTAYVWEGLDLRDQVLRLVLEVEGETEAAPTDWIRVAYPVGQAVVPAGTALLTADGSLVLAPEASGVAAYDAETGDRLTGFAFGHVLLAGGDRFIGFDGLGSRTYTAVEGAEVVATVTFDCRCEDYLVADASARRVAAMRGGTLELLDLTDGSVTRRALGGPDAFLYEPTAFVGRYLLLEPAVPDDGSDPAIVADVETAEIVWRSREGGWDEGSAELLPDGRTLLTTRDGRAALVDLATGATLRTGTEPVGTVAAVSADGATFVAGGRGLGSIETLGLVRTALPLAAYVRPLAGGERVRGLRGGAGTLLRVETVALDAVWEQVPLDE